VVIALLILTVFIVAAWLIFFKLKLIQFRAWLRRAAALLRGFVTITNEQSRSIYSIIL